MEIMSEQFLYTVSVVMGHLKNIIQIQDLLFLFSIKPCLRKSFNRIIKQLDEDVIDFTIALQSLARNFHVYYSL